MEKKSENNKPACWFIRDFKVIVSNYWKIAKKSKKYKEQELSQSDKISIKTSAFSGKK